MNIEKRKGEFEKGGSLLIWFGQAERGPQDDLVVVDQ